MYLQIKRQSSIPMIKQLYQQLKNKILNGDLKSNERLPSSRKLAEELKISRIVIVEAYEMLSTEGYTKSVKGSGTFVSEAIAISRPTVKKPDSLPTEAWYKDLDLPISFRTGLAALDEFPRSKWLQCYKDAIYSMPESDLGYNLIIGHKDFRKTLAEYLYRSRGIHCHEDQIVVTNGAVQGLFLLLQYFKKIDKQVIIEDPLNKTIREMVAYNQLDCIHQAVDDFGLVPSELPDDADVSCILTTPSHQYPMGGALPISRRIDLIRYARKKNCYIIEDDYDSEYRYDKGPVESLHELDSDRVIYLGSFSKILTPSIRIGYIVLPENLIKEIYSIKRLVDIHCPTINQLTMHHFIKNGYLNIHLAKMKKLYKKRRLALIDALSESFGNRVRIIGSETGIHLVAEFTDIVFTEEIISEIADRGVFVLAVSDHSSYPDKHRKQLILGYGNLTVNQIQEGIKCIHDVIINCN